MFPSPLALPAIILLTLLFIILSTATILRRSKQIKHNHQKQPPPGPPAWPVIGNLHLLGKLPHRSLQSLSNKYGSIMSLRLGQVQTVVISSGEAVELLLKKNDTVFASRPKFEASDIISYGSKGLVFSEYGPYWRNMRKLCTLHLLSVSKVESFEGLRREELGRVVETVERAAAAREVVDVTRVVTDAIESMVYKMVLGADKDEECEMKEAIHEGMRLSGAFNLADYVPCLGGLDLQGLKGAIKKTSKAFDEVLEKIIKEHEDGINSNTQKQKGRQDFVDIMLSLMHHCVDGQNYGIDRTNIKAILLDMIAGALETSATTILWALSELLRHPRVMKTLQDELDTVIGMNKMVKENDLPKLSYLEMVIKETLRLYPAGAFVPRESTKDVMVDGCGGYYIKKGTRVLINLWAIGRDPKVWSDDAEMFCPERFKDKDMDFRGLEYCEFIPFGLGRRGCPGMHLGLITVKIVLAQLIHSFNWELPWGLSPNELDMSERFGLSLPRAKNLLAVPTSRILGNKTF
ncbi:cytochrome P450 CYP736A12-like [Senna tora]|uniref:Cytochrome P450 CYP736A12-like n=1 Tax=Senna tora TaxID=362788 RepID=A0A834TDN0_9FABA|nr:cytochrome P450 CYP736A12-like [Senna tora]